MAGAGVRVAMNDHPWDTANVPVADLESQPLSSSSSGIRAPPSQEMTQFFQGFNNVTRSMGAIRLRLPMLQDKMDKDLDELLVRAGELRTNLEALNRSNAASREIGNRPAGSRNDWSRMSATSRLKTRVGELAAASKALGQRFQDGFREIVETCLFTAYGEIVEESMIERVLETEDIESILQNAPLGQGRDEVLDTVADIRARHRALKDMERKLHELDQILSAVEVAEEAQFNLRDYIDPDSEMQVNPPVDNAVDPIIKCLCIAFLVLIFVAVMLVITLA